MIKGRLFYIMGPSGAGKDSLIQYARKSFENSTQLIFAHRYITRPIDLNENHIALTDTEFDSRQHAGLFALHWQSHHLKYGIGCEIDAWLDQGCHVLINGSREYLDQARAIYPHLIPILISVNPDILAQRLLQRGRETEAQIAMRLKRAAKFDSSVDDVNIIQNNSDLRSAGEALIQCIQKHISACSGLSS